MVGETDLSKMLADLKLKVLPERFVFCTIPYEGSEAVLKKAFAAVTEPEGLSLILSEETAAQRHIEYDSVFTCITLMVHSSLCAVGLTAAVSGRLAENGISANVVAGYYHDHIFVPEAKAEEAVHVLSNIEN